MEKWAMLDKYFNGITVEKVESEKEAWSRLKDKPRLRSNNDDTTLKRASDNKST
jgi:hypothetical protein